MRLSPSALKLVPATHTGNCSEETVLIMGSELSYSLNLLLFTHMATHSCPAPSLLK